ncbi:MAG: hypothetical protein OXO50_07055 [Caldilineaceae bacterium]|nr:hypothetical protein [Caldilineaceae bacterium]
MIRFSILLATALLCFTFGGILGGKYFTYVLFVGIEPTLYPCPYSYNPGNQFTCAYRPHEPAPELAVWWHGWPTPEGQSPVPQPSGNCLRDILFFDRLPPLPPQAD